MAKIYADANGKLLRVLREAEEPLYPNPPEGSAITLDLDDATNAAVLDAIASDWNGHSLAADGKLSRKGNPVALAADSPTKTDRKGLNLQRLQAASADLTPQEIKRFFRVILDKLR